MSAKERHLKRTSRRKKRCPTTGKLRWLSQEAAVKGNQNNPDRQRVYLCPHCDYWHTRTRSRRRTTEQQDSA